MSGLKRDYSIERSQPFLGNSIGYYCSGRVTEPDSSVIQSLHYHDHIELGICLSGSGEFYVEGLPHFFEAGDATVIFSNQLHYARKIGTADCKWMFMAFSISNLLAVSSHAGNAELIREIDESFCGTGLISRSKHPDEVGFLSSVIARSVKGFLNPDEALFTFLAVYETAVELLKNDSADSIKVRRRTIKELAPVISYISENYTDEVMIEQLAEIIFVSPQSLYRKFKIAYSCSPIDYIQKIRIRTACTLIASGELSITQIANRSGYRSISSFNRQFQKNMACSPSEWGKRNR